MNDDVSKVADQLRRYVAGLRKRDVLGDFLDALNDSGEAFLFGGAPRDVAFGARKYVHDLDIFVSGIIDVNRVAQFSSFVRYNNFGGLRLYVAKIEVDAWELQKSYPFVRKLSPHVSAMNLLNSVCFSTDGVAVSLKTGKSLRTDAFEKSLRYKLLDFVRSPRDVSPLVAARIARLVLKLNLLPSRKVANYFLNCLDVGGAKQILDAELRWGDHRLLTEILLEQMRVIFDSSTELEKQGNPASTNVKWDELAQLYPVARQSN